MVIVRILFFPLRLLYFGWCRLRNSFRPGDTIIHRVPDRFTLSRPVGWMAYFLGRQDVHYIEYLAGLKIIAESPRVKTLALILGEMQAGWVEVEEIAVRLDEIRATGKEIVAFAEGGNLKTAYLMAAADRRYVALNSDYQITFPSAEPFFVKDTLNRLGVRVDSHAAGKFKSAAEMFTRSSFSPPARKAMNELLNSMRASLSERLLGTPGMNAAGTKRLLSTLKNHAVLDAGALVKSGFAAAEIEPARFGEIALGLPESTSMPHAFERETDRRQREQKEGEMAARLKNRQARNEWKKEQKAKKKNLPRITTEHAVFQRYRRSRYKPWRFRRPSALAFVNMEGSIQMGRPGDPSQSTAIEAHAYRDVFKQLEGGPEEAVFLYINSPGGSATASEMLYQDIAGLARQKPVFALLGPVAASGGFYIASAAHRIFAARTSITGSIGVITMRPNLKGLYHKLGVKKERIAFDRTRDLLSEAGPLSPASLKLLKDHIRSTYRLFIDRVATGRGLAPASVEAVAEGRVWTGEEFASRGLIDEVGDIFRALEVYKERAGIPKDRQYSLTFYPDAKADFRRVLQERMPGIPGLARLLFRPRRAGGRPAGILQEGSGIGALAGAALIAGPTGGAAFALDEYLNGEFAQLVGGEPLTYLPDRLLLRGLL